MTIEIDPTTCSDEDIIKYIKEVRGSDSIHYKSNWIILRVLKILVKEHIARVELDKLFEVDPDKKT